MIESGARLCPLDSVPKRIGNHDWLLPPRLERYSQKLPHDTFSRLFQGNQRASCRQRRPDWPRAV